MRPCHLLPVSFLFQKSFVCFKSSNFVVGVFHHWRFPLSQREKEIENVFILFCWLVDDDGSLRTVTLLVRDLTWIAHEMTRKPKEMLRERQHSLNSFSRIFFCASSLFKWIPIPIMRLKNAHRWTNEWKKKTNPDDFYVFHPCLRETPISFYYRDTQSSTSSKIAWNIS